jgi:tRNA dimethylallyltransferase
MERGETKDPFDRSPLCCLVGPTAAGKSALALEVAERAGAEILSLDSMLVYRGLDVGTAKPSPAERARVRHHLIDVVEPTERYDVSRWLSDARHALADVQKRGARALFVGGTGFYLAALLRGLFDGPSVDLALRARLVERREQLGPEAFHSALRAFDPRAAERLHPHDAKRVVRAWEVWEQTGRALSDWQTEWAAPGARSQHARLVGLRLESEELERRIRERTASMLGAGWLEEALRLRERGALGPTAIQALGYAEVLEWADSRATADETLERITLRTRQFARRQQTWFRKLAIAWLAAPSSETERARLAGRVLEIYGWSNSSVT